MSSISYQKRTALRKRSVKPHEARPREIFILRLEPLEGETTSIEISADTTDEDTQNFIYCIISVSGDGAHVVDNGYRSIQEAKNAWPEALIPIEGYPNRSTY